jgi:alpha/beta superfamily hydrolase
MRIRLGGIGAGFIGALLVSSLHSASTFAEMSERNLEERVCGFKEPIAFWFWSIAAGRPDPSRLAHLQNVEDISLSVQDGRMLRGYVLRARSFGNNKVSPKGYLLVAQGNAMLADQILSNFSGFANSGLDVYIFDYRGYGRSEGKRRLKAIVSDYGEIIEHLNSLQYPAQRFYGMSFGGIVVLNALKSRLGDHRVVIDSTPSRLSDYGCPETYDPVRNLPQHGANHLMIVGLQDHVVTPAQSKELLKVAEERGATILREPEFSHPFMDPKLSVHQRRMQLVKGFLLGE